MEEEMDKSSEIRNGKEVKSEANEKEVKSKDSHMYWDIIDIDTLSIGRSTPAFADSFSKQTVSSSLVSSNEIIIEAVEEAEDDSTLTQQASALKKKPSYFRIEEGEGLLSTDSPNLPFSDKKEREEAINHALEDNQALIRGQTVSPAEIFDVPSIDTSCFEADDKSNVENDASVLLAIKLSPKRSRDEEIISCNNCNDQMLPALFPSTEAQESSHFQERARNSEENSAQNCFSAKANDAESESSHGAGDVAKVLSNENESSLSNTTPFLHLVFGNDQAFRFHNNHQTRCRSTSADEDLAILRNTYESLKSNRNNLAKSECVETMDFDKGYLFSLFEFPASAIVKMKEIFLVFVLGNVLYDQKSPLPFLLSHTLAFLVGVFVGRKISLSHGTPNSMLSNNPFLVPNPVNSNHQSTEISVSPL